MRLPTSRLRTTLCSPRDMPRGMDGSLVLYQGVPSANTHSQPWWKHEIIVILCLRSGLVVRLSSKLLGLV